MSNGVIIPLSLHCAIKYLLHNMLKTKYIHIEVQVMYSHNTLFKYHSFIALISILRVY